MSKNRDLANLLADGSTVTTADMSADTVTSLKSGRKNLIINGGFDVWQRGTSFTSAGYTADRWIVSTSESATATTKTANRDTKNTLRITFGSVVSCNFDQRIEEFGNIGYNQQVTLSFWIRGSKNVTGDFCRIRNHTTATTLETLYYDVTTSWTKVTKTFSASTAWSKDDVARLYAFSAASASWASGDWVEISDVQLELGDTATDFEHRSYGEELALCQRYCYVLETSNTYYRFPVAIAHPYIDQTQGYQPFPTVMRVVPTLSTSYNDIQIANNGSGSATAVALSGDGDSQHGVNLRLDFPSGAITTHGRAIQYRIVNQTDWKFTFDAEL